MRFLRRRRPFPSRRRALPPSTGRFLGRTVALPPRTRRYLGRTVAFPPRTRRSLGRTVAFPPRTRRFLGRTVAFPPRKPRSLGRKPRYRRPVWVCARLSRPFQVFPRGIRLRGGRGRPQVLREVHDVPPRLLRVGRVPLLGLEPPEEAVERLHGGPVHVVQEHDAPRLVFELLLQARPRSRRGPSSSCPRRRCSTTEAPASARGGRPPATGRPPRKAAGTGSAACRWPSRCSRRSRRSPPAPPRAEAR